MEDFSFWWYIIAALIYFFTRSKKKKEQPSRPGTEKNPAPSQRPKSFEDLLKEITEGAQEAFDPTPPKQEPVEIVKPEEEPESIRLEGERRVFADDESRKVYEDSIKMAEGAELVFEKDEHFQTPNLFKGDRKTHGTTSFAEEIMDGFDTDEAKKAIIYSEIMNRKY